MSTISKVLLDNVFSVLQRGDRKIKLAQKKAIIFVGLTRVGKSTAFNWALKKTLVGVGNLKSYYVTSVSSDSDVAPVGECFASVTLAPNIYTDFEEGVSLIDMAGYQDTRNYIGVIGVSYFLKALFQQVRQVKFVIVMDQNKLMQTTCQGLIKTLNGFINMFNFDIMTPQIKKSMMDSLTLLITRSRQSQNHYQYLDDILKELANEQFHAENKNLIIEILQSLRDCARVEAFQAAKNDKNPEECTFISRFTQAKGWKYFDFQAEQKYLNGKSLINLPFTRDYDKLSQSEQTNFTQKIQQKIASYLGFSEIIKSLVQNYKKNWESCLTHWKSTKQYKQNYFDLKEMFAQVAHFLEQNDVYNSRESIKANFRINYEPPSFVSSIKIINQIQETLEDLSSNFHDFGKDQECFKNSMKKFNDQFGKVTKLLRAFCLNQEDEQLMLKLQYVLCRGFRQFQKLYQLKDSLLAGVVQGLKDTCNGVFEENSLTFTQKIINQLTSEFLFKVFSNLTLLNQYSEFINEFERNFILKSRILTQQKLKENQKFVTQQKFYVEIAKADLLLAQAKKIQALHCYINAFLKITQVSGDLRQIFMIKLKLVKKIVIILKSIPKIATLDLKQYALQLCHKYKLIEETGLIYQSMIDSANTLQKLKILEDYARFSAKWGKIDKAIELLYKKLSIEEQNYEDLIDTIALIKEIVNEREKYMNCLGGELSALQRIQQNDASVSELLTIVAAGIAQLKDQE